MTFQAYFDAEWGAGDDLELEPGGTGNPPVGTTNTHYQGDLIRLRLVNKDYSDTSVSNVAKALKASLKKGFKNDWSDDPITGIPNALGGAKDMYCFRFTFVHVYSLLCCFEETGDPTYLNMVDEIIADKLTAGVTYSFKPWPNPNKKSSSNPNGYPYNYTFTDANPDPSNTYRVGTNIWPGDDPRSAKNYANRDNQGDTQGAPEMPSRRKFLYYANNIPGNIRQYSGLTDYGHDYNVFDIELCYATISVAAAYLYANKDRRATADRDWAATAQAAYDLLEDVFFTFSKRTAIKNFAGTGTYSQARHPILGYFETWQDIIHGSWSQNLLLASHYEHKRARTGTGNPLDKTGSLFWFGVLLSKLRLSPVGNDFSAFSVAVQNITSYQLLNWSHQPYATGAHAQSYLSYPGPMWTLFYYWGMKDSNGNALSLEHLQGGANTVGMVWTGSGQTNKKVTTSAGKYVRANTDADKATYPFINASVDGYEFKSPYKGGSRFDTGNAGTGVGGIMVAFDPTPEHANITVLARKTKAAGLDMDSVVANPAVNNASRKEQAENFTWLFIALRNPWFTTWNV